jgi:bacterioferritin-associated ferredoxin
MIVCICRRVCDKTIRAVIQAGAETVDEVRAVCGAASGCGACADTIEAMIDAHADCPRVRLTVLSPSHEGRREDHRPAQ